MLSLTRNIFRKKIVVLHETDTVFQASRAMSENDVGSVIVADRRGYLVGMLTDRDLVCNIMAEGRSLDVPIGRVMSRGLIWARDGAGVDEIISLMNEFGIRRIPIVTITSRKAAEKCLNIVTLDDLIAYQLAPPHKLSEVVRIQINQEVQSRYHNGKERSPRFQKVMH